jgi:hypothetical protein
MISHCPRFRVTPALPGTSIRIHCLASVTWLPPTGTHLASPPLPDLAGPPPGTIPSLGSATRCSCPRPPTPPTKSLAGPLSHPHSRVCQSYKTSRSSSYQMPITIFQNDLTTTGPPYFEEADSVRSYLIVSGPDPVASDGVITALHKYLSADKIRRPPPPSYYLTSSFLSSSVNYPLPSLSLVRHTGPDQEPWYLYVCSSSTTQKRFKQLFSVALHHTIDGHEPIY